VADQQALGGGPAGAPALDLSIVTVSYNVREYLAACLASLSAGAGGLRSEVIVVDNASGDGSADHVVRGFPHVRLLRNVENLGFARAVNRGLAVARGRWLLLLDPDTTVPPGALAALVEATARWPEVGLAGPALDDPVTGATQASCRPFMTWRSAFAQHTLAKAWLRQRRGPRWQPVADQPSDTGFLIGACLLIRREVFETLGGLDEAYFLFCEDMEYCRRALRAGWKLLYTRQTRVFHHEGKSAEQEPPAWMRMVTLASLLHYLDGEPARHPLARRRLFKFGYVGAVVLRAAASAVKVLAYALAGSGAAAQHRRRLARNLRFLAYTTRVARL
jgi:GT2 family glycosyltransferase